MLDQSSKSSDMSDVAIARALVQEAWPEKAGCGVKVCVAQIFLAVKRVERRLPREVLRERPRQWTERRVRAIWQAEARRIDNYEMADLEQAALEAAQYEFRESINRAERLAAFISAHEKTEDGQMVDRLRKLAG